MYNIAAHTYIHTVLIALVVVLANHCGVRSTRTRFASASATDFVGAPCKGTYLGIAPGEAVCKAAADFGGTCTGAVSPRAGDEVLNKYSCSLADG